MSGALPLSVISREVRRFASEVGFDRAGVAGVADTPEHRFFPDWLAEGHAGEMSYLEKRNEAGELKRASLANAAPWARSVVACALNYNRRVAHSTPVDLVFILIHREKQIPPLGLKSSVGMTVSGG